MIAQPDRGLSACLVPLLDALGRGGGVDAALRSVEIGQVGTLPDFLNALAALGFTHRAARIRLSALGEPQLPCLAELPDGTMAVLLRRDGDSLFGFNGKARRYLRMEAGGGVARAWRFFPRDDQAEAGAAQDWFWHTARRFRRYVAIGSVFSIALGLLSLLYPVLMTAMYGKLPTASEPRFVASLAIGAALYTLAEFGLRLLRGALLDYTGARFGQVIGAEIFRRLLSFQASFTESAPLDSQIRRVRDFETIATFVSGPAFAAIFDIPFIILNIAWLAGAGPRLLAAPLIALLTFSIAALALFPLVRKAQASYSVKDGARHELFSRIVAARTQLADADARRSWIERFATLSRRAAIAGYELQAANGLTMALSSLVVSLGGLATLLFGILDVLAGKARPDALVVAMLLVWRVLEPARSAFVVVTQLDAVGKSVAQIKRFLALPLETPALAPKPADRGPAGDLSFQDVFFRYGAEGAPALAGVSFTARKGSIFSLSGHEGAGKTTVVRLALGLYRPQSGRIVLGGQNILQIEAQLLRRSCSLSPATPPVFRGSVLANLMLGAPELDERDLREAAAATGLVEALAAEGLSLDSPLDPERPETLPVGLRKILGLTRAIARHTPTLLVDEPERNLPAGCAPRVRDLLRARREEGVTVIILSNDAGFLSLADGGARLDGGRVVATDRGAPRTAAGR